MDLPKITCDVCGESNFTLQEGFFYCDECGTQTQITRDFQVDDEFNEGTQKFQKSHRLQELQSQNINYQNQLTSWECFNYLLSGLTEEMIQLGAKKELKTVTLQLWAVYLRKMEIAFFDKRNPSLPKLGPLFSKRDAAILYNRKLTKDKTRKRKKSNITNEKRRLKKQKRDLMEKQYLESSEYNTSEYNSSSSATTSRAIRLEFSRAARKIFKKVMPKHHLAKHAEDYDNVLDCHDLTSNRGHLVPRKIKGLHLSRKTVYTILYLALNLSEDKIQLADMLRFMRDGYLATSKISHFFPDNVADNCVKLILSQENSRKHIFGYSAMRAHAALLSKLLSITELKLPNILALVQRYLIELRLPVGIGICVERLLNFCPPEMKYRLACQVTPCYEGRAMAYIIFVMKLLFGLDDIKEKEISLSAKKVNEKLEKLSQSKLFVWEQWRNYIEMRKIILAQCHCPTSICLNEQIDKSQLIDLVQNELPRIEDYGKTPNALESLQQLLENFNLKPLQGEDCKLKFFCSMTPNNTYLELILNNKPSKVYIPDYMYEDHSVLDIDSFIKPSRLRTILMEHNIKLDIQRLECNLKRNFLGIFANYSDKERRRNFGGRNKKVNFNIEEEEWLQNIPNYEEIQLFPPGRLKKTFKIAKSNKEVKVEKISKTDTKKVMVKPETANRAKKIKKKSVSLLLKEKIMELLAEREKENELTSFKNIPSTSTNINISKDKKVQIHQNSPNKMSVRLKREEYVSSVKKIEDKVIFKNGSIDISKDKRDISSENWKRKKQVTPRVSSQTKTLVDNLDLTSLKSFDIFSETDMNPLNESLNEPRKISEENDLFREVSEDDTDPREFDNENFSKKVQLAISALDYWTLMGELPNLPNIQYQVVRNHMPTNFLWLLDTCSHLIGIDSEDLLQELLTIESYLIYSLDAVKDVNNLVFSNQHSSDKDLTRCIGINKQLCYTITARVKKGAIIKEITSTLLYFEFSNIPNPSITVDQGFKINLIIKKLIRKGEAESMSIQRDGFKFLPQLKNELKHLKVNNLEQNYLAELSDFGNSTKRELFPLTISHANWFKGNGKYKLRLQVTCPNLFLQETKSLSKQTESWFEFDLLTKDTPQGAPLEVRPTSGLALQTIFQFPTNDAKDT